LLCAALRPSAEEQRSKFCQVAAPDHPGMRAGRLDVHVLDVLRSQPGAQLAVWFDQTVVRTVRDPKQAQVRGGRRIQRWVFFVKLIADGPAGTESADPTKFVQRIQAGL
jgi:hypothetical protein